MSNLTRLVATVAAGAAAMYWLDPDSGRRRRAVTRDQLSSAASSLSGLAGAGGRDLKNRAQGIGARVRSGFTRNKAPDDDVLAARVRAAIGRAVSHSGAIDVLASDGRITLAGSVLQKEHRRLLATVHSVRGVDTVEDHLCVWERPDGVSELQGGRSIRPTILRENWRPATRLLAGAGGAGLMMLGVRNLFGARPHGLMGSALLAGGAAALFRSWSNAPLTRITGTTPRHSVDIGKTLRVRAPVEEVFAALARFESFPSFMRNVRRVRATAEGRSHWEVAGPAGVSVEWDSEMTAHKPNELLAWRTVPSSTVNHAGIIRFAPEDDGTRLDIRMSYAPPAGALGHLVAKLFGADPKKELDEDLLRLKSFLESGVPPRDAARPAAQAARSGESLPPAQSARGASAH